MKTLHIKNMVCNRCITVVRDELTSIGIKIKKIELGKVELYKEVNKNDLIEVQKILLENGFELIEDRKVSIVEKIKVEINDYILLDKSFPNSTNNLSKHLTSKVGYEYYYLSSLFSSIEGITIEKYFIFCKIEYVKDLLVNDELTLAEIAFQLGYNSTQYLSNQFKKITGLTPTHFKQINSRKQNP